MNEIRIPRLGWSMETGVFVRWLKREGELVKVGEPLFELEGEKATQEIESVDAGILRIPADSPEPGSEVAVGALVGYLAEPHENLVTKDVATPLTAEKTAMAEPVTAEVVEPVSHSAAGTGGEEQVFSPNVVIRAAATPRAKRVARELGVDVRSLAGSGRKGRIREQDVRAAGPSQAIQHKPAAAFARQRLALSARRRTIAQRMHASQQQAAHVTLTTRADATNLVSLRQQFRAAGNSAVPAYTDIIAKLVAACLAQHPHLAGRIEGNEIVLPGECDLHVGLAVDTDDGLLVPVLRDVANIPLLELATRSRDLIDRARHGRLSTSEMQGGVFTITNLGAFGIDAFTPIINAPECAILGLGAIRREAVASDDDRILIREQLTLSLTFDHRLIDGAPAARFLQLLRTAIENPSAWLLTA